MIIHYIIIALFDKCEPVAQCRKLGLVEDRVGPGVFLNEGPHKHLLTIFGAFNGFLKPMQRLAVIAYSQFCPYLDDLIDKPIPVYLLDLIVHLLCVFTLPQTSVAVCNVDVYGKPLRSEAADQRVSRCSEGSAVMVGGYGSVKS